MTPLPLITRGVSETFVYQLHFIDRLSLWELHSGEGDKS
jgi:hypothetical protein